MLIANIQVPNLTKPNHPNQDLTEPNEPNQANQPPIHHVECRFINLQQWAKKKITSCVSRTKNVL